MTSERPGTRPRLASRIVRFLRRGAPWVAVAILAACGGPKQAAVPAGAVVVVVGDSITAGYGVQEDQAWPARLASLTGWKVINGGVSGDRSADALARLPALLDEHAPALVMVEIGGNDMLHNESDATIERNIDAMLMAVKGRGARAVVVAIPRPSAAAMVFKSLSPARFYRDIATRNSVPMVEDAVSAVLSESDLRLDPLHPNGAGHAALAEKAVAELRAAGLMR
jgi:acyl-CoA thioesterase I